MATNRTRWYPDTCGCVLEFEWDSAVPEASRTHTVRSVTPCVFHPGADAHIGATLESGTVVPHEQNTRVGKALGAALTRLSAKLQQVDLDGTVRLKDGITLIKTFSGTGSSRILTIQFQGVAITTAERNQLQAAIDTAVGAGKVVVQ